MAPVDETAATEPAKRSRLRAVATGLALLLLVWLCVAYLMLPLAWRGYAHMHPALEDLPGITYTANGVHGDPLNVALVGTEGQVDAAMLAAKWYPADPITLRSSLRIATATVFHRAYDDAPVSSLYFWGRKEDLAFEQPVGDDPRQRHHVRFWRAYRLDKDGRPLWVGSVTFDKGVGLSHTTGQITHHISGDVDAERDRLMNGLRQASVLSDCYWVDDFHKTRSGRNGGGDAWHTDGRLEVGVIAGDDPPERERPAEESLLDATSQGEIASPSPAAKSPQ